jgi:hypothetical protein
MAKRNAAISGLLQQDWKKLSKPDQPHDSGKSA